VVASRTSTGTEIAGSTNSFLPLLLSPATVSPVCKPASSSLIASFCLDKLTASSTHWWLIYVLDRAYGNIKVGPRRRLESSRGLLSCLWRLSENQTQSSFFS